MSEFSMFEFKYLAVYLVLWQLIRKSWRAQNTLNKKPSFPKCALVMVKAPCVFPLRLKISQILGIFKTEYLKIQFWGFEDLKTAYTLSTFTKDIFCLRLMLCRQHILNLKICCAGGLRVHCTLERGVSGVMYFEPITIFGLRLFTNSPMQCLSGSILKQFKKVGERHKMRIRIFQTSFWSFLRNCVRETTLVWCWGTFPRFLIGLLVLFKV